MLMLVMLVLPEERHNGRSQNEPARVHAASSRSNSSEPGDFLVPMKFRPTGRLAQARKIPGHTRLAL
jgi:hypothetical protein